MSKNRSCQDKGLKCNVDFINFNSKLDMPSVFTELYVLLDRRKKRTKTFKNEKKYVRLKTITKTLK